MLCVCVRDRLHPPQVGPSASPRPAGLLAFAVTGGKSKELSGEPNREECGSVDVVVEGGEEKHNTSLFPPAPYFPFNQVPVLSQPLHTVLLAVFSLWSQAGSTNSS